ncbi:hypothetical protein [Rhodococcus wratislaviensis]|uniref:hypothetical protein n=1 Tax=Rhodococcus wratislaviensis TaxID=44752 RepID=UPI003659579F
MVVVVDFESVEPIGRFAHVLERVVGGEQQAVGADFLDGFSSAGVRKFPLVVR